jgi:UDP-N-acetylglucosamine:LPS N-acetylglucosamine transferase
MKHLVVMAAGTGGHVIPGLAVAREMQTRGWTVSVSIAPLPRKPEKPMRCSAWVAMCVSPAA